LTHERGVNPRQLVIHSQLVDELWKLANENGALDDPRLAPRLAQAFVEIQLFRLHNWRSVSRHAKQAELGPVGSINKLWWSEMSKRFHDTAMDVLGEYAPLWRGAADNPGDGAWQRSWLYYQASSIWAGTNEIQRNVIGERTLGLPR
jgi:alkylation response protein AidB-like acyl-CoA dehydrogenase